MAKIDLGEIEKFLLAEYPDEDDKEGILTAIEEMKAMSEEELSAFIAKIDNAINDYFWDAFTDGDMVDGIPYGEFRSVAYTYFQKEHPEFDEDSDGEDEAFDEFMGNLDARLEDDFKQQAYENLDSSLTDEMWRSATKYGPDELGSMPFCITEYLAKEGLLPHALI